LLLLRIITQIQVTWPALRPQTIGSSFGFNTSSCHWIPLAAAKMHAVGIVISASLVASVAATELTKESWDGAVAGKTVFVKFQAPW